MLIHRFKKALFCSAFFIALFPGTGITAAAGCPEFKPAETAEVRHVHDGDTLFLRDNRKIRLIGIDTPELARKEKPEQPYAVAARDYARQLIKQHGDTIELMPGVERADRYGRLLYHIRLANGELLQSALLKAGYAIAYNYPPNLQLSTCYQQNEKQAQASQKNIWSHAKYKPVEAANLKRSDEGFHIIRDRVTHIGESRKAFWINFEHRFAARIAKKDFQYFNQWSLESLVGKRLEVRGWIRHYKTKAQVSLRHPSAVRILD